MKPFRFASISFAISLTACGAVTGNAGPNEMISLGLVRPISCERKGPASYSCVMRNHSDALRGTNMECASFDPEGRMIGRTHIVGGLVNTVLQPSEERIAKVYFEDGAETMVCADVENSIPSFGAVKQMASDPTAQDIVSVLSL